MKIYVLGSTGMLGRYIAQFFKDSIPVTRQELNANSLWTIKQDLQKLGIRNGDVVINAMGLTNKRVASEEDFKRVNGWFPIILAKWSMYHHVHLIHVSTDCVFTGKRGQYTEDCQPDSKDVYGISKALGDLMEGTIIRTSIIGENPVSQADFLEWVRSNAGKTVKGYSNCFWNGVTCLQLAKIISMIIVHSMYWKGVRHIFSPKTISKADMVKMVSDEYGLNIKVESVKEPYCDRSLSTLYGECDLFEIPDLQIQIKEQKGWLVI